VVGFTPTYDSSRKLWFADIQLDVAETYFPFVRLALARYHPISIDGAHLSSVVLSDFVQVAPDRRVDYELGNVVPNGKLKVTLRGPGHGFADGPMQGGTIVVARLERREHGDAMADEPLGWKAFDAILLNRVSVVDHQITWEGTFDLKSSLPNPLRVSVIEAQALRSDNSQLEDLLVALGQPDEAPAAVGPLDGGAVLMMDPSAVGPLDGGAALMIGPSMVETAAFGYRIVFADATIALP
jgi:hypothetical protein